MKLFAATLGSFLLFAVLPTRAQSPDSGSTSQSSAKPADPAPNAPVAAPPEKKKPKKVWTDDNIGSAKGTVSVVGDGNSSSQKAADKQSISSGQADEAHQKQIENYRKQIQEYQDQIASIDKQIDKLRNFKAENTSPSGGLSMNQGYNMVPVEDQVKQLEDKKNQLQARIDDTEVAARKDGIDPGDIR